MLCLHNKSNPTRTPGDIYGQDQNDYKNCDRILEINHMGAFDI